MKVVGLITEYNPFHNGHLYHIQKALELTGADRVVVVMSGNYVQRGTPALMPKELRTKAALCNGASLVLELPLAYATGTAEQFAFGAVSILHKLGCIDTLCFGSECGNIEILQEIASILHSETDEYKTLLQQFLREGASFPVARSKALDTLYPGKNYKSILDHPNNILGIEYLKSLLRLKSTINPCTIKRSASEYHDTKLNASFSSATAIRQALISGDVAVLKGHVPDNVYSLFETTYLKRYPIESNDFSLLLKHRLMLETKHSICDYADVSEELANRIYNNLNQYISFDQFCEILKTKEITYSRISRALLHIMLGVKPTSTHIKQVRILGFRTKHTDLFSAIKEWGSIDLISKLSDAVPMPDIDIQAANLYESVITDKFNTNFINEYEHPIIRI